MTTAGEGGMLTTNDAELWNWAWAYKDHGKSFDAVYAREHGPGYRWLHESIGSNWRMLEVQAAVGRIQLKKMAVWQQGRTANAAIWQQRFARWRNNLRLPIPAADITHAWYKFYAYVRPETLQAGWTRDRILQAIAAAGVPCYTGGCPEIYREKAFVDLGYRNQPRLPVAQQLGETSLMFLLHPTLSAEHIHAMADAVDTVLAQACG